MLALLLLQAVAVPELAGERISERLRTRAGETCLVCNEGTREADAAYLSGGQRVAVHAGDHCEAEFLRNPARFLAVLRPNSILFHATASRIDDRWIWLGLYALLGLIFGGLSAQSAVHKGRSPLGWFFIGMAIPLAGYVALAMRPPTEAARGVPRGLRKVPLTRDPVACAGCGRLNHPSASRCIDCGATLDPTAPSEVERQ